MTTNHITPVTFTDLDYFIRIDPHAERQQ